MTKKIFIIGFVALITLFACASHSAYSLELISVENQQWAYKINENNKTIIYQETIPCISGNKAFSCRKDARKTGNLVIKKLNNGQIPTITMPELREMGVVLQ